MGLSLAVITWAQMPYKTLDAPYQHNQVMEFFSFSCGACYFMEKELTAWRAKLPKDVTFKRMPLVFQKSWRNQTKAFYIAQKLGIEKSFSKNLFKAVHDDKKSSHQIEDLKKILLDSGADADKLDVAFQSMMLDIQLKRDEAFMTRHQLFVLPTLLVHGRYLITLDGLDETKGQTMFSVADDLLKHPPKSSS